MIQVHIIPLFVCISILFMLCAYCVDYVDYMNGGRGDYSFFFPWRVLLVFFFLVVFWAFIFGTCFPNIFEVQ